MTSPSKLAERLAREQEIEIFNSLPKSIRDAINSCERTPPKASTCLNVLLRGVSEEKIVATIRGEKK